MIGQKIANCLGIAGYILCLVFFYYIVQLNNRINALEMKNRIPAITESKHHTTNICVVDSTRCSDTTYIYLQNIDKRILDNLRFARYCRINHGRKCFEFSNDGINWAY